MHTECFIGLLSSLKILAMPMFLPLSRTDTVLLSEAALSAPELKIVKLEACTTLKPPKASNTELAVASEIFLKVTILDIQLSSERK